MIPEPTRRFLSLKWKALIFSSLILIGIAAILTLLSYLNLQNQFERQRNAAYQQYRVQVGGLIESSAKRLQQIGWMILSLENMRPALQGGDVERIGKAFEYHWPNLQIDAGLELVRFYSKSNQLMGGWGIEPGASRLGGTVLGWIWYANDKEVPVSVIDCSTTCMQYAVVPMLAEGRSIGVVVLGRSLVDIVLGFKQVSGTDIGVMVIGDSAQESAAIAMDRWLENWNGYLVAVTTPRQTLAVLRTAAAQEPDLPRSTRGIRAVLGERHYEVGLIPLHDHLQAGEADLVVITDISADIDRINADTRQALITAGSGFLIAEMLLLGLLWVPMSRLKGTAMLLPLLSKSRYQEVRESVARSGRLHLLDDETDVLDHTAVRLSHQLESLELDAREYAQTLAQRAEELAAQKDFVTSLLETAQAVIVTQNSRGEITMVNQYGESLLGYREQELQSETFAKLIDPESLTPDILRELADLAAGRVDHLHQELCMVCRNGGLRDIAWYHSLPPEHGEGDPRVLSVGIDITDRKNAEQRLSWLADHDPLTGLFNRRRFQFELERAIAAALERKHTGALLFMDIDQFKDVNDSSGHPEGDALLKDISSILSDIMRDCDLVARLGGDEFAIVLPETGSDGAVEIARRVKDKLAGLKLVLNGRIHRVSTSIGIAMFPRDGETVSELLSNADLAMYQAKEGGRGCWHMFASSEQVKEKLNRRVYWKARIEQALAEEQFILFYQPIVDVNSGAATHFESLLRLRNEDGSITGPFEFIEVAETTGLIHRIDRMVVRKAIEQLEQLHRSGHDITFSINLSAHAFNDPEIFHLIEECVGRICFEPSRLIFEVTETAAVADFACARESMRSIKELGCLFALDDFGVGFSSFAALRQLPVDYVKIDGSFIKMMTENPEDRMLVRALSQVAQAFGKKSVAEFVENAEIIALLREYGVDYAQGFYLGKPLPPEQAFAGLIPSLDRLRRNRDVR